MVVSEEIRRRYAEWMRVKRVPATSRRRLLMIERRYHVGIEPDAVGFLAYLLLDDERFDWLCRLDYSSTRVLLRRAWEEFMRNRDRMSQSNGYRSSAAQVFLDRAAHLTGYRYSRVGHAVRGLNRYYRLEASAADWKRLLLSGWSDVLEAKRSGVLVEMVRSRLGGGDDAV